MSKELNFIVLTGADGTEFKLVQSYYTNLCFRPFTGLKIDTINLGYIVQYLTLQKGVKPPKIQSPLVSTQMNQITSIQNAEFVASIPGSRVKELMIVADNLDIPSLVDLLGAKLATLIMGKPTHEIYQIITNYFNE
jgi:hypothetical protein